MCSICVSHKGYHIQHCPSCCACISGSNGHFSFLGVCLCDNNFKYFVQWMAWQSFQLLGLVLSFIFFQRDSVDDLQEDKTNRTVKFIELVIMSTVCLIICLACLALAYSQYRDLLFPLLSDEESSQLNAYKNWVPPSELRFSRNWYYDRREVANNRARLVFGWKISRILPI
uniref:Palmitoyltransferase n=1 Tax=Strombidium inclinatum TaxID=197538 RepID=A0A7S3IS54_9SPIT|mmetsp:Transcript_33320/g.51065  ORF Transcript_33320/g.51065 Transcript_33320/m.51065 type:complete len:171 (+) Transcript_33320:441-953(+)